MTDVCVDLKLDKAKLNSQFDGYKLSLDNIPTYKQSVEFKPELVALSDHQYSYQHVKSFGNLNVLVKDPWKSESVYFVDERWKVIKTTTSGDTGIGEPISVLQIPEAAQQRSKIERVTPTFSFPSQDLAFINTGTGLLHVAKTFDRNEELLWKIVHTVTLVIESTPSVLLHSVSHIDGNSQKVDCLILHVENNDDGKKEAKSLFKSVIEWLSFTLVESKDDTILSLERTRTLEGKAPPDYAAVENDGKGVIIASENKFSMVFDSTNPVVDTKPEAMEDGGDQCIDNSTKSFAYTWNQTDGDVNIYFNLPSYCTKTDIIYKLTPNKIHLALENSDEVLLDGELCGEVDTEESTWLTTNSEVKSDVGEFVKPDQLRLQVILTKKDNGGKWTNVVNGDDRGKMLSNDVTVDEAFELVQNILDSEEAQKPVYNAQELEDCDNFPDERSVLLRIDGETHHISHQINLGSHQWLFNCHSDSNKPPCICIRHDVDGIMWQPTGNTTSNQEPWEHVATFNAFGYVQASKQQRKFTSCAPNFSYAVLSDSVRHLYIYWQPSPIMSPLRNRKTGQTVDTMAKQQLVSLETVDMITGIYAGTNKLFVMAGNILHVMNVKHEEIM